MQREKCLFIFNLPEGDLKTNLEKIQKLHYSAYQIKESNSHFQNTTLVTCLFNKSIVQDLAKNLDKKKIDDRTIHVLQYDQLNLSLKPKTDLYKFNLHTLLEWQKDTRNEQLIVCNNDSVRVFENMWNGEIVNEKCFESRKAVGSKNGLFVAVMDKDEIIVYGNVGNDLKPFQVIKMKNVFDIYFLDDDFYLFVNYREVFEYTCVVNLLTGKNIIIVKCMNEKVKMFKDKSVCYLENTKCIFKRKDTLISDKLFFDDEMKGHEKFALVTDTFMGHPLSEIDRIHEYNHFLAVLTKEKATTIYLYYKGELVKKKAYPNFVNCKFYNTEERIFVVVEKEVDERKIISVETIKPDGESTLNNIKEALTAIEVADDGFVITTENYNIMFFDKTGIYSLVKTIKKTHKCILSLNKNGKICCVYDYDKDMIEFYDRGVLINRVPHANCTSIKWSHSGLYCATMSLDSKSSGLVQMFDVNGNFLWKNIFNKLTHFEWRCFYANEKCLEYVKENYDKLIGEIEEVDKDIKQTFALQAKTNIEEAYNVWKAFLMQKRSEYEQHMMNNK